MSENNECIWHTEDDATECDTHWTTSCGKGFVLSEGKPSDGNMKYCTYCGKPIVEDIQEGENDE